MAISVMQKVKDKVRRSSSLHRKKLSKHSLSEARKSEEHEKSADTDNVAAVNTSHPVSSYQPDDYAPRLPQSIPAWHIHKGTSRTAAGPADQATTQPATHGGTLPPDAQIPHSNPAAIAAASSTLPNEPITQDVPVRSSSLRPKKRLSISAADHTSTVNFDSSTLPGLTKYHQTIQGLEDHPGSQQAYMDTTANGDRSLSDHIGQLSLHGQDVTRKPLPDLPNTTRKPVPSSVDRTSVQPHQQQNNESVPPIPPRDVRRSLSISSDAQPTINGASHDSGNLRLPEGFDLTNTTRTIVDTEILPAVTHEKIHRDITEIVQEQITRDIHVHHYYVYEQPITVVEVLPAKHYVLDPVTGEKIEIQAPLGWMMPENMQPRVADTTMIKALTRHYLVNEEFPNGISEPPPPPGTTQHANEQYVYHPTNKIYVQQPTK